jgi:hypothetical protein
MRARSGAQGWVVFLPCLAHVGWQVQVGPVGDEGVAVQVAGQVFGPGGFAQDGLVTWVRGDFGGVRLRRSRHRFAYLRPIRLFGVGRDHFSHLATVEANGASWLKRVT